MNQIEILGFIAGIMVAVSVLPQVIKAWRTKSTSDISIYWSIINSLGQILWIWYGLEIGSASLVVMSGIALGMNISMISLKVRFG